MNLTLRELYSDAHIRIYYDYVNDWIYANWTGEQNLETVQAGAMTMLRMMKEQGSTKVLNDNRKVTSMWSDAAEWGGKTWFPAMQEAVLQYFAWIYSPNIYSRLSTDETLKHTSRPIVATFDSIDTAANWLRNV